MIKNYTYTKPDNIAGAVKEQQSSSNAKFLAGGTDLIGVINEKIKMICPDKLVSLKGAGLDYIKDEDSQICIGAMTTLKDLEDSDVIRENCPVLWQAAHQVASPQIRHMATLGGNLCQEPRCWYYRYQDDKFHCMRKGGELCNAMMGNNIYHSIFGGSKVCDSPCESQCPNGTAIPEYFDHLRRGEIDKAAKVLWEMNPLAAVVGRVCPHTCQSKCNRNEYGEPVSIRNIERTVGDYMLEHAEELIELPKSRTGKKIAVIGAGPAGLVAAYFLQKEGHQVAIYDDNEGTGGMLRYGIPAYRLPRIILDRLEAILTWMGVEFHHRFRIGRDITMAELIEGHDAVFAAIGAWKAVPVGCPGDDAAGVVGGIDFLRQAATHQDTGIAGKIVAVVGGGNTAMDCCRSAMRLGAAKVYNFYRRTEAEMPAEEDEIREAKAEGIEFCYLVSPAEIETEGGRIKAVKLQKMELGEPDESGRRRPVPIEGAFETVEVDVLLSAIGQAVAPEGLDLEVTKKNWIATGDDHTASKAKVFAAGDAAIGPKTAIEAIADARKTADAINRYLGGGTILRPSKYHQDLFFDESCIEESGALQLPEIEVAARTLDQEDIASASIEEIRTEANRCYNCGCVAVSPSDTAPALIALDAVMVTTKREISAKEFFRAKVDGSTIMDPDEILQEIRFSKDAGGTFQQYQKFRTRETIDFPIAGLAANIDVKGGVIDSAKLVFSGVAPTPYEFTDVEAYLKGKAPSDDVAAEAADMAIRNVLVLKENLFKVQVVKAFVRRAVAAAK